MAGRDTLERRPRKSERLQVPVSELAFGWIGLGEAISRVPWTRCWHHLLPSSLRAQDRANATQSARTVWQATRTLWGPTQRSSYDIKKLPRQVLALGINGVAHLYPDPGTL